MERQEQAQKKAPKLIKALLVFAILGCFVLILRNVGFPKEINETHSALVITEDGQTLECTVEIRGEVTNYLLNPNKFERKDQVTIYADGKRIILMSYYGDVSTGTICAQNEKAVCVMTVRRNALVLETDLQNIFPDMESQRCTVSFGYDSFKIPGEYAELFMFLN